MLWVAPCRGPAGRGTTVGPALTGGPEAASATGWGHRPREVSPATICSDGSQNGGAAVGTGRRPIHHYWAPSLGEAICRRLDLG